MSKKIDSLLIELASKIYLSPSDSVVEDCVSYLSGIKSDLEELKSIDTEQVNLFYGKSELALTPSMLSGMSAEKPENEALLKSLFDGYEFTNNIQKQEESTRLAQENSSEDTGVKGE